jgi:prepilin-type N-terminal cleavage/methylation domain-containing protein
MKPPRPGYTLFELVLVVAVLAAAAAVAYPSVESMYGYYRVTAAVDQVRGAWAAARAHATEEGRPYRCEIAADSGKLRVAPDGGDPGGDGDAPPFNLEADLPKGVRVTTSGPSGEGGGTAVTVFLPDGTARDDAELTFQAPGSRSVVLRLRALTGIVTGRPAAQDGGP